MSNQKSKINIGILGCANIAIRSVIPAVLNLNEYFNLVGIASRDIANAEQCAQQFGFCGEVAAFGSYQSLLDCPNLDAVYIPLPNSLHAEWIEKALAKNLHVLVEKSLACDYKTVVYLNKLAEQQGVVLIENFQFRFHSQLAKIKEIVASGKIGDLRCLKSFFGFPGLPTENDIRYQKELGGGALLDAGAYPLKIAQIFMGENIEVAAANLNYLPNKEVDIWGGAYIKQKNGDLFGEIAFGFNNFYQCNIEIWGSNGKLYTNRIFTAPPNFEPILELETVEGKEILKLSSDNHFENMLIHFYKTINGIEDKQTEYQQNINQARLLDELKTKSFL